MVRGRSPAPADHGITLGQAIEVEGHRDTLEKNTAGDNCWLALLSCSGPEIESHLTQNGASQVMISHDYKVSLVPKPGFNGFSLLILVGASSIDDAIRQASKRYPHHDVRATPVRAN